MHTFQSNSRAERHPHSHHPRRDCAALDAHAYRDTNRTRPADGYAHAYPAAAADPNGHASRPAQPHAKRDAPRAA